MRAFFTKILGIHAYVEYHYTPGERPSMDSPGCDPEVEISKVMLEQGEDSIRVDGKDLSDDLYEHLCKIAMKDAES